MSTRDELEKAKKKWTAQIDAIDRVLAAEHMAPPNATALPSAFSIDDAIDDPTDALLFKARLGINFYHIASNVNVWFKAFLNDFRDDYQSEWSSESVYGRMDPIETFQGTKRVITLSWDVVAFDLTEAQKNMYDIDLLISMLYPTYGSVHGGAGAITSSPLLKLKFANLITQPGRGPGLTSALEEGLVGRVGGITYAPVVEHGFFTEASGARKGTPPQGLWPKVVSLSCDFTVFHTHKLGWRNKGKKLVRQEGFPHGAGGSPRTPLPVEESAKNLHKPSTPAIAAAAAGELASADDECPDCAFESVGDWITLD